MMEKITSGNILSSEKNKGSKKSSQTTFQSNLLKVKFGDENGNFTVSTELQENYDDY